MVWYHGSVVRVRHGTSDIGLISRKCIKTVRKVLTFSCCYYLLRIKIHCNMTATQFGVNFGSAISQSHFSKEISKTQEYKNASIPTIVLASAKKSGPSSSQT